MKANGHFGKLPALACAAAAVLLACPLPAPAGEPAAPAIDEPLEVVTPWGQHVQPNLDDYISLERMRSLAPGEPWVADDALARRLRTEAVAGRLAVERYPRRLATGVYVLGHAGFEQLSYLLDTGAGLVLVDPSLEAWQDELRAQVRALGHAPAEVKWVLLTHAHIDHGQAAHLWRRAGARLLAGEGDAQPLESCNSIVATWVEPQAGGRCTPTPVDQRLHDGDILRLGALRIDVIAAPGHTPGSTAYRFAREGREFLLSGDVALHDGRHAWMANPYADWAQYRASLAKLAHFSIEGHPVAFDVLLPGHGTIDLDMAQRSIRETLRIVDWIMARRAAGEDVDWIEPYAWHWREAR